MLTRICFADVNAPGRVPASPRPHDRAATGAFTLVELLVALAIVIAAFGLLVPALAKARAAQRSTACLSTLRQIGHAFQLYASDNSSRMPDPGTANRSWEQMLRPYFDGAFYCGSDEELYPAVGSSYDWRDTGEATTTLAGRSIAESLRPGAVLAFEALPGWHSKNRINVVRLSTAAESIIQDELFADLSKPLTSGGPIKPIFPVPADRRSRSSPQSGSPSD
jgi:type II secretory pathway pseudopilin PulG